MHGDLKKSQEEADRGYRRLRDSSPQWAWKFRILEAESLLWRGMYAQALTLVDSARPDDRDLQIAAFAIKGAAHARLHQFAEAENELGQATQICQQSPEVACGDVIRARGVLAVQRGQLEAARQFFGQSLQFARAHDDRLLEVTALLNLGLTSLREEHFDEAIDWTEAAYQASTAMGADDIAQNALGNLSWAYYNLGDSEKSLVLSLEAERLAAQAGDVLDQLFWITNTGYVYADLGDFARAKDSYLKALDLATKTNGREGIYNALRALALVCARSGELQQARLYSDEAIGIAQKDNNRSDELYPLLVKGMIAVQTNDAAQAERLFREVEQDKSVNAPLKWRAEHGLARLYEGQKHLDLADGEYHAALDTFEAARTSLTRSDARLPFSTNAARIYDDYVHFLIAHGSADEALRWADYSRARTLSEGLGLLSKVVSKEERAEAPALNAQEISRRAHGTILFYWLGEKQSYLWAITPHETKLFLLPPGAEIEALVQRYRKALSGPEDVLGSANEDGRNLYEMLVAPARGLLTGNAKIVIIPDGSLNNLNFETLLVVDPTTGDPTTSDPKAVDSKPHFLIEDADIVNASSLRVLAASSRKNARENNHERRLLLIGDSVSPNKDYPELPRAADQMASVGKHFPAAQQRVYRRERAIPAAYLAGNPEQFSHIHFVAHGTASRLSPLDSTIVLSKGGADDDSFKLYARDIIRHPLKAELVTISACYSAGERAYSGEGLVGLAWAFLRAGAHNVIAGLWEVSDASTEQLMDRFYEELDKGASPDASLRAAKLSLLRGRNFRNPFYWASFQLYTGS